MDANLYLLLFFVAMIVLSLVGLGLSFLIPGDDVADRPSVVRRSEPAATVVVRAPSCRYRVHAGRREHFPDAAGGQRSRMNKS
ncbi:hypothetical protein LMG28614_00300 [Paraburkholderia ultramafica]|uniref:Uncharacterized protein n=1 Tax=Paraburkholderia ultramafica TaxID=1544867 RepID=A0A6S7CC99_9BURK|nr:hypothetical protein [Paraburkholderia ultramafica]CAB3776865.1 hypothetical protein LMG28614_00300 [Paraburkholderia ultramafica]